ncbi:hypothetical protein MMC18_003070 [Xylographa bjoerkii]|nr:hypothetical protein [Xylographa bjoerkii]
MLPRKRASSSVPANAAQQSFTSANESQPDDPPPAYTEQYVEVAPEQAEELIPKGHAVPVDTKLQPNYSNEDHDESSDNSSEGEDERNWALDEALGDD